MRLDCLFLIIDPFLIFYRETTTTVFPSLSRTTSFSTSVSSRSSTVELLTPTTQPFDLPNPQLDDSIGEWVSSISIESLEDHTHESHSSKKRSYSDLDFRGSGKRVKLNESDKPWSESLSESLYYLSRFGEGMPELSAQFDFKFPPVASIGSDLGGGGPLQIDLFEYANWGASQLDHPWKLCKSDFLSTFAGTSLTLLLFR